MVRPRQFAAIVVAIGFSGAAAGAEEPVDTQRTRAIPARMANVLAEAARRLDTAPKPTSDGASATSQTPSRRPRLESVGPANTIVRLPTYVVTERRPPRPDEVLTEKAIAGVAMARYLGDETDLDRALNTVTLKHLWNRIPVLGKFALLDHETNEERALRLHRAAKKAEAWENLLSLQAIAVEPGTGP